uniref:Uncharacterized protein n=1 Tax=Arundo donax TaxID=35708 RepID=A0A0A9EZW2_ARUDO
MPLWFYSQHHNHIPNLYAVLITI